MEALAATPFSQKYFIPSIKIDWYGTLILSRYPCRFYKKPFDCSQMERSLLMAVVEFAQKDSEKTFKIGVNCVHLESSESSGPRMQQIEEIKALNEKFDLSIIAGDFNFSDGSE
jgi:endonuclease/exonuclease/phosphatase family metal-dependent hydrolase